MSRESIEDTRKWITTLLTGVAAFFLIRTYDKVDYLEKAWHQESSTNAAQAVMIEAHTSLIQTNTDRLNRIQNVD